MAIIFSLITNIIITTIHRLYHRLTISAKNHHPLPPPLPPLIARVVLPYLSYLSLLSIHLSTLSIHSFIYPFYISILSIYQFYLSIYLIYPISFCLTAWCFVSGRKTAHHATFCVTDVTINALSPLGTIFHIWRRLHGVYRGWCKNGFFSFPTS